MRKISLLAVCSCMAMWVMGIPAHHRPQSVMTEQGEEVVVYQYGDEFSHWYETEAGVRMVEDAETGLFRQAVTEINLSEAQELRTAGRVADSGMEVSPKLVRRAPQESNTESLLNIAPRGLVILVNFSDKKFSVVVNDVKEMISSDDYYSEYVSGNKKIVASGSARQYFIDQSMGQYKPEFQVVGPYTLSKTAAYYGSNDSYGQDAHADEMIVEACQLASQDGVKFSDYDNNNDGEIDFVYVIYAGYGENDGGGANAIWPHTYWLDMWYYPHGNDKVYLDGKLLNTYACCNEKDYSTKKRTGIGTFCHEFSHVLGLPDFYITSSVSSQWKTMGNWDIMDHGPYNNYSNTPPAYSAYERYFMGWMKPTLLTQSAKSVTLDNVRNNVGVIITEADTCNLKGNDPRPTTFWMLENRQRSGWDEFLPGEGLLLTRVKYSFLKWEGNTVNNIKAAMGVDLIEADGSAPRDSNGKETDAFPAGATEYLEIPAHELTNIRMEDGLIYFDLNGGGEQVLLLDVEDVPAAGATATKVIRDGRLLLMQAGRAYDVLGRCVAY